MNVGDFLYKSKKLEEVQGYYITPDSLRNLYPVLDDLQKKSFVYHYIMDNSPYGFVEVMKRPLLFEQIRQYISHILDVDINHIKLIGSTKTGFAMDSKNYGRPYAIGRDLDFTIIDSELFGKMKEEFNIWKNAYVQGVLNPKEKEKVYWDEHLDLLPLNLAKGFIDAKKLPNRSLLPVTCKINQTMSLIVKKLYDIFSINIKSASVRIYDTIDDFYAQQNRNIMSIIKVHE